MSDDDKKTYKQLMLIAVLAVFAILFMFAAGALYAEHVCFEIYFKSLKMPDGCSEGKLGDFVLELAGIVVGVLGAIKLLGQ